MITRKNLIIILIIAIILILYLARSVMLSFIFAAAFAYIFSPVVDFIQHKFHFRRVFAVLLLYIFLIGLIFYSSFWIISKLSAEAFEFQKEITNINAFGIKAINNLPEIKIGDHTFGLKTLILGNLDSVIIYVSRIQASLLPIVSGVVAYSLKILVFIVASYYFLKDGKRLIDKITDQFKATESKEIRKLLHQINIALGGYLRGQIILIILMAFVSSVVLTIIGVKYSLILGILTGFLELIPFIGPIAATAIVASIAFISGENHLGLSPTNLSLLIIGIYFILRQLEDYFVVPQLLGRLTRLHPLVILFAVLAGGAIAGPVGFVLAVPIAASGRVLLEYYWENSG